MVKPVYPLQGGYNEMEEVLIDFLKQTPHKKGGPKDKVTIVLCTLMQCSLKSVEL
jgi:rhodanese-related sulfurtransferase